MLCIIEIFYVSSKCRNVLFMVMTSKQTRVNDNSLVLMNHFL